MLKRCCSHCRNSVDQFALAKHVFGDLIDNQHCNSCSHIEGLQLVRAQQQRPFQCLCHIQLRKSSMMYLRIDILLIPEQYGQHLQIKKLCRVAVKEGMEHR